MAQWEVILVAEVATWFGELVAADQSSANQVEDAIDALALFGPALGRPLVDRIKGSQEHHLRELRPGSSGGSEIRIL
ncbi:type II toxin-antitoxin system RelE/ParE family toxin, partial [Streptomyces graminilatus]|uniref:type II toxin-antitoxin system RelE/ParE family toxin n=1 Tax=Streptomyces graminilatus TaxID=1464070 RepID=UPI000B2C6AA9